MQGQRFKIVPPEPYSCFSGILFWDNSILHNNMCVILFSSLLQEKMLKLTETFCHLNRKHKLILVYVRAKGNCYAYNCAGGALPIVYMCISHFKTPLSWANQRCCTFRGCFFRSGSKMIWFIVSTFSSLEIALLKENMITDVCNVQSLPSTSSWK